MRPSAPTGPQLNTGIGSIDTSLLAIVVLLAGVGAAMLFSASYHYAGLVFDDDLYFIRRHGLYLVVGLLAGTIAATARLQRIRELTPLLLAVALAMMLLTFVPGIGVRALGAQRWLGIAGQTFEPSELVKLALVLYLAHILSKKEETLRSRAFSSTVLPPLLLVAGFGALIYLQNDFSSAFFVLFLAAAMFFVAGVRLRYFFALGSLSIPLGLLLLLSRDHRVQRIIAFVDPAVDPAGSGFQVLAARAAVSGGGMWGRGIGQGQVKLGGIPEAHSDFVFAVVGEELGLVGVLAILALFCALGVRGYRLAREHPDRYRGLVAFGLTTALVGQALVNMAVVAGLLPATGLPLPFVSSGGSSLLVTLTMCGLLLNISRAGVSAGSGAGGRGADPAPDGYREER